MSVAFRRDSDEEHLEPKFELPIPPGPNLVTARGLALIEAKVAELELRLAEPLPEEERKAVLRDARYWRARAASAQLAPVPSGEVVGRLSMVTVGATLLTRTVKLTDAPATPSLSVTVTEPMKLPLSP